MIRGRAEPLLLFVRVVLVMFILMPLAVIMLSSLTEGSIPEFPPSSWSLKWYSHVLSQPIFITSAWYSLLLALLATTINAPIAIMSAFAITRGRFRGHEAVQTFLMSPLIVPAVVTGIAILLSFTQFGWRNAMSRLVFAHIVITLPYLIRTVIAALTRIDSSTEEAAMTLGATPIKTFLLITLPQIMPGIIAGGLFAFIISFDNVSVSLFLSNAKFSTLPIVVLGYVEFNMDPSIAALSTLLIILTTLMALLIEHLAGLRNTLGS